jgi:hypothetical protein
MASGTIIARCFIRASIDFLLITLTDRQEGM